MKDTSLIPVIAESNRLLAAAVQHFGLSVDPARILVTIQSKGRRNALGWFWHSRWSPEKSKDKKEFLHEINLSAEYLREHNMGETLLHELAHAENHHCGIQDTDKTGRRHNKKFKSMAERLGLSVKKDPSLGFAFTDLAEPAKQFLDKIKFDRNVYAMCRIVESKSSKQGTRLLKCECPECGYVVRTTQKWLSVGLPTCPCGETMEAA
jgi:hypothetical protein